MLKCDHQEADERMGNQGGEIMEKMVNRMRQRETATS
jgi:hypothetical protein